MRIAVFLVIGLLVLGLLPSVFGVDTFRVVVSEGGYALYRVTEAYNVSVGDYYLKRGDRIGFVVKDVEVKKVTYVNGSMAFMVEIVKCDVYLNDRLLLKNVAPQQFGLFSPYAPPGTRYWKAQEEVLKSIKRYYEDRGGRVYYSLAIREDYVRLYVRLENRKGVLEEETKTALDTGVLLSFSRHIYSPDGRVIKKFSGSNLEYGLESPTLTSTSSQTMTTEVEHGGDVFWLWVLAGMILIIVVGGILGGRKSR